MELIFIRNAETSVTIVYHSLPATYKSAQKNSWAYLYKQMTTVTCKTITKTKSKKHFENGTISGD